MLATTARRRAYPAISLAAHGGDLTAIGNDYSFADLFARQVEAYGRPGDALAVFTTSGKSENIFRALQVAKALKLKTIAFLGRDGGKCAGLADVELLVGGKITARIQEGHKFLLHTICELVEEQLCVQKRSAVPVTRQQPAGAPRLALFREMWGTISLDVLFEVLHGL